MAAPKKKASSVESDVPSQVAKSLEAEYRSGVDISLYELADRFEADGHDWRAMLLACGYSEQQISEEVDACS